MTSILDHAHAADVCGLLNANKGIYAVRLLHEFMNDEVEYFSSINYDVNNSTFMLAVKQLQNTLPAKPCRLRRQTYMQEDKDQLADFLEKISAEYPIEICKLTKTSYGYRLDFDLSMYESAAAVLTSYYQKHHNLEAITQLMAAATQLR